MGWMSGRFKFFIVFIILLILYAFLSECLWKNRVGLDPYPSEELGSVDDHMNATNDSVDLTEITVALPESKGLKVPPQEPVSQPDLASQSSDTLIKKAPQAKSLSNRRVSFQVKGDYAYAAEDILLGRLNEEQKKRVPVTGGSLPAPERVNLWPTGVIPVAVHSSVPEDVVPEIRDAFEEFHQKTSIRFVNYQDEKDAVVFLYEPDTCASHVGRIGGHQPILVSESCGRAEVVHELMHTLGFIHEHQRVERDTFVQVFLDRVSEDKQINFEILPHSYQNIYQKLSSRFDYESITIYPPEAFAKNTGESTLLPRDQRNQIQPSRGLSPGDVSKIEEVYERGFY